MKSVSRRRTGVSTKALSVASLFALTMSAGCAQSIGDIDRTQPDLIDKSNFDGQWFIRQTVIDVPPTSPAAFIGEFGDMEMVVWDIQQDYLIGYRAYERVPGTDQTAATDGANPSSTPVVQGTGTGRNPDIYRGNPIVAYRIESHVDVQRGYNARTGEQNNVISENTTDRPWYDRKFMRVDWSSNAVDSFITEPFSFWPIFAARENFSQYIPANEGGKDAFHVEVDDEGSANYIDFTVARTVTPSLMGCIMALTESAIGDCTGDEIKIRTSMLKVDPEREQEYVPMVYDDRRMGEFGFFRTERPTYDRRLGSTFTGLIQLANRHDIWATSRDTSGNPLPYSARTLRPIEYTLSDDYPEELIPSAIEMAENWDVTLKESTAAARKQTVAELEQDLLEDTGAPCLFCLDPNEDDSARNGDLRRNFIYWVHDNQMIGPLGYGPTSSHPETGRIVASSAYVYGAGVDRQAEMAKEMVDLINGDLNDDDLVSGDFIRNAVRGGLKPIDPRAMDKFSGLEGADFEKALLGKNGFERLQKLQLDGTAALRPATPGYEESQLRKIAGKPIESMITPEEWTRAAEMGDPRANLLKLKAAAEAQAKGLPVPVDNSYLSVTNWGTAGALSEMNQIENIASKHSLWLRSFSDPTLVGLAREAASKNLRGDDLFQYLREQVFKAVMLHEMGHTLGLRHNFAGSADPLNYHDEFWVERNKTIEPYREWLSTPDNPQTSAWMASKCSVVGPLREAGAPGAPGAAIEGTDNSAACAEQQMRRMSEYQYSTIMDYGGRVNSDFSGLGRYDRAAIASGYGDLVEVFDREVMEGVQRASASLSQQMQNNIDVRAALLDANEVRNPVLLQGLDVAMVYQGGGWGGKVSNYENFPQILGGVENISKRHFVARSEYNPTPSELSPAEQALIPVKVPYMACYDEFVDTVEGCHRWDFGADAYEIVANNLQRYKEYYVFNNFQRDRIGFDSFEVLSRTVNRYFMPMVNMYQHWYWGAAVTRINSGAFPRGELGLMASTESFNTLWNVLSTPQYGAHTLDSASGTYVPNGQDECGEVVSDVAIDAGGQTMMMPECVNVPRGTGRSLFSRYNTGVYDIYRRVLESGHFYEQIGALIALTSSNAAVVGFGSDVSADFRSYLIPFNLLFQQETTQLFSSVFAGNNKGYAQQMGREPDGGAAFVNGRSIFGTEMPAQAPVITPGRSFTTQLQSLVWGMAFLKSGYDTTFVRRGQISVKGSGDQRDAAPEGYESVEAVNPLNGVVYVAYRGEDTSAGPWYAAELLDKANNLVEEQAADPESVSDAQINRAFEDIEITRGLFTVFENPVL
jgi:hypothetical protein